MLILSKIQLLYCKNSYPKFNKKLRMAFFLDNFSIAILLILFVNFF
ncbi:hypothetical protein DB41_IQ00060 [Neochlamydia sp. TUME1]|nr:hypothetical protein DB41_IQ00060 [Neochlamydia sp. TUME1]